MTSAEQAILARARNIKLLVLDVDGILTDGRLYFSAQGEELKCFHVRDGAGIVQLRKQGIHVAIISGRDSPAVVRRMSELGVEHVHQGISDKLKVFDELVAKLKLTADMVACMGDDSADVEIMKRAGLALTVPDAHVSAKQVAHWVSQAIGGTGAVREACDLLLSVRDEGAKP